MRRVIEDGLIMACALLGIVAAWHGEAVTSAAALAVALLMSRSWASRWP